MDRQKHGMEKMLELNTIWFQHFLFAVWNPKNEDAKLILQVIFKNWQAKHKGTECEL